ncbi:MAG TPA: GH116 family glycosyl hydrolase [Victivallales bacterium]|nr:GH116 family glycosyl hydrolase [Victivallales bacterium]HPO89724.1 GH116 family glycosyl hydrolase [Victivallales bacterium]HRR06028.1 GH116 family glycosyl hydrolase [Victivallales bacterium]HRR29234.1 GH116 family glycosyl hydrolase [Victivallales bacterium]HRU00865.1 GH116 family glycosyl hydrolase [Victivallales bacterium]
MKKDIIAFSTEWKSGKNLDYTAFPIGGIGAGMFCLEGSGKLSNFSIWHKPEIHNEPYLFSAIHIEDKTKLSKVLEGPIPDRKIMFWPNSGNGLGDKTYGFPRFKSCRFRAQFPFAQIELNDPQISLDCEITGWSPFIPGDSDNSSLPFAALEYKFKNKVNRKISAKYYFASLNFLDRDKTGTSVKKIKSGFMFLQKPTEDKKWAESYFSISILEKNAKVNTRLFRGGWFDTQTMIWKDISEGKLIESDDYPEGERQSPGAVLAVKFTLEPSEEKTIKLIFNWYVPYSQLRTGPEIEKTSCNPPEDHYRPWYTSKFKSINEIVDYSRTKYDRLKKESFSFSRAFFNTSLPEEFTEAIAANLSIIKSPTVLRQSDGRLWGWEGCFDSAGCCHGSCTHVWNYAQAIPHLFPDLERSLRESEFNISQNKEGHQNFRTSLPIRPPDHNYHAAADGQLGGIMKFYREWRISGDSEWMKKLWKKVKDSLEYCIKTWDPDEKGIIIEPHHNTYDIEFWGADGLCQTFYLGALKAAFLIQDYLGEDSSRYKNLYNNGKKFLEEELFNGEYVFQKIQYEGLKAGSPVKAAEGQWNVNYSPEAIEILKKEGPKYQYGEGCLSDGILGEWISLCCGIGNLLEKNISRSHLRSVFKYNYKYNLSEHINPQRSGYAMGNEGGLLVCSWPRGNKPSIPFPYSDEVWTGIEYQVASHLMMIGEIEKAKKIVKTLRKRYDGTKRNQFNEYECGHWYARAMSSYALLQGFSGAHYDAVEKILYLKPVVKGDFKAFFACGKNYGYVGVKKGKPFFAPIKGTLKIKKIILEEK